MEKAHSSDTMDLNFTSASRVSRNTGAATAVVEEGHVRILVTKQISNDGELVINLFCYVFPNLTITYRPITRLRHLRMECSRRSGINIQRKSARQDRMEYFIIYRFDIFCAKQYMKLYIHIKCVLGRRCLHNCCCAHQNLVLPPKPFPQRFA